MENIPNYSKNKKYRNNGKLGFTLVEILLTIGIFSVFIFATLPLIGGIIYQSDLESASLIIVSTMRQAESGARNGLEDSVWGVKLAYPQVILFKGGTYDTRDNTRDMSYSLGSNLTLTGLSEIRYSKMNAIPYASDNTIITNGNIIITNLNSKTVTININAKGRLSY